MKRFLFWADKKQLLRQAIFAWVILFISVFLFSIFALLTSIFAEDKSIPVLFSFLIIVPALIYVHIYFWLSNYQLPLFLYSINPFLGNKIPNLHNLIEEISNGDKEAFSLFYEKVHQPLVNHLKIQYSQYLSDEDIEDIVQMTMIKILRAISSPKRRPSPYISTQSWVYSIANAETDRVLKIIKKYYQDPARFTKDMDEKEKNVVTLRWSKKMTFEQIAENLNIPVLDVKRIMGEVITNYG